MKNWTTDTTRLQQNPQKYEIWQLEQMINYGLDGQKLSKQKLIKYWNKIDIDPQKREYLEFVLWPEKQS